jgi:hypothetical protein
VSAVQWFRVVALAFVVVAAVACDGSAGDSLGGSEPAGAGEVATAPLPPVVEPHVRTTCLGVPAAKCDELVAGMIEDYGPGAVVALDIRCLRIPCTVRTGDTTIDVLLANGDRHTVGSSWHTAGDPEPLPIPSLAFDPTCVGLDRNHCAARVLDAVMRFPDVSALRGIDIACATACTPDHGRIRTVITFADGSTDVQEVDYGPSG